MFLLPTECYRCDAKTGIVIHCGFLSFFSSVYEYNKDYDKYKLKILRCFVIQHKLVTHTEF